ncbi:glycosyltransferase [Donghicola mangrovi]|nr:glycosyltransferase [Donghicola mangrovi]
MTGSASSADYTTLQTLMWPEAGICTERTLYVKTEGPAAVSTSRREIQFAAAGSADFGRWFNAFNAEKWKNECALNDLSLLLTGEGTFELSVTLAPRDRSWDTVINDVVTLDAAEPLRIDLSHLLSDPFPNGLLFFSLKAMGQGMLTDACWQTQMAPQRQPDLAIAVTTFKRETYVQRTIERFRTFREASEIGRKIRMIVTDNGQTLSDLIPADKLPEGVTIVPNANLGGAGGFTRGLLQARDTGASHCLFMDDDASVHMESIERTWIFLAYATDPTTAVAGSMITETHRWAIWENGALFFTRCLPRFMGTDLRSQKDFTKMELAANKPTPWNFYAGWWYFAFPVDCAEHLAFPFFVRGDDVSFSIANHFNTVSLNGVVSFQESFIDKESPQTWYLDLRSHMAHHLSLPSLEVGSMGVLKIAAWFMLRNLPRMHYETLSAINLAIEDVIEGPQFFDQNADMAQRRGDLKELTNDEAWKPIARDQALPPRRDTHPPVWYRHLMKLTLNGLLVPGFNRLGKKITLHASERGHIGYMWGASEITYLNTDQNKYYTVRHSKASAWRELRRFFANAHAFSKKYPELSVQYRLAYNEYTSEPYWRAKLGLTTHAQPHQEAAE